MRLSRRLLQLVAVAVVPPILLAVLLASLLIDHERDTFRAGAIARTRAFMTAVDAAVEGHFSTLHALAAERSLASDDIDAFRRDAAGFLASQSAWINVRLTLPSGRQLVDVRAGAGVAPAPDPDPPSLARALDSGKPAVGDVVKSPVVNAYAIPLRLPVLRQGRVAYVISALVEPKFFESLIHEQDLAADWVSGLTDRSGRFIARIPYRSPAAVASADFLAAVGRAPEGWYRGLTVEGTDSFTAYKTSQVTGWHVGLAVPARSINASAYRTAVVVGIGGFVTLLLALGLAYAVARRIAAPMSRLAQAASSMSEDGTLSAVPAPTRIPEVQAIANALIRASVAIRQRQAFLHEEQQRLKAASQQKDEFLAMLGHELRNPLSVMTMSTGVLRLTDGTGPAAQRAILALEHQTQYMNRLIDDLLDVSRLTHGKISLRAEDFDLSGLARSIAESWWGARKRPPARIALDLHPVRVHADRTRMEQVIVNLLDNADKFSPPDMPIRLALRKENGVAVLTVADAGEGIAAEMIERVFEPFVQVARGSDRAHGGIGIGLTLVKRLVELHGGTVGVESGGAGKGAVFTVRLPAVAAAAPEESARPGASVPRARLKVMVVEDNADARELAMHLLAAEGHEVLALKDGPSALAEAPSWQPDIVLMDIGLPGMDGYEVARRLRAGVLPREVPLVAISGYGQPEDVRQAAQAGFDMHITKPVTPETLRATLGTARAPRVPAH